MVVSKTVKNSWIVNFFPSPDAKLRLFCFPHAGGGAIAYRAWAQALSPLIEVCAIRLPGRESRFREARLTDTGSVVEPIVAALETDKPFAFFGHSMGTLLAFETARALRRQGLPAPQHLFMSGRYAPQMPLMSKPLRHLPDGEFLRSVQKKYQGIPSSVFQNRDLMDLIRPILRADFTLLETYSYQPAPPLDCPITVMSGLQDIYEPYDLFGWKEHTTAEFDLKMFPGGHFYLDQQRNQIIQKIIKTVEPHFNQEPVLY